MDEKLKFVARLLDAEKMASPCRGFNISRKTGYKKFDGLQDVDYPFHDKTVMVTYCGKTIISGTNHLIRG